MRILTLATLIAISGCRNKDDGQDSKDGTDPEELVDADGDGFAEDEDCDDGDATVNPDADEVCDEVDNDCDGEIDEGALLSWYLDADADGWGQDAGAVEACEAPSGYVAEAGDCDDDEDTVFPDAPERCDELDNDCDDEIDEEVTELWFADADDDGFGNAASPLESCDPPTGFVEDDTDCDDLEPAAYPDAEEICDEIDNDCDEAVDEEVELTFYTDADDDGWGDEAVPVLACELPAGASSQIGDCDDADAAIHPNATELCDGVDNDCDETTDEADAADAGAWYADLDGDGYGDAATETVACEAPSGTVGDDSDCDDGAADVNPAATEICDSIDNDCNGVVDRVDDDGDSFVAEACGGGDCDDADAAINPGASETWYDGVDQDCDGGSDYDQDGDGDDSDAFSGTDCDDTNSAIYVGAPDPFYDGVDADCAGNSDYDADADGYDSDAYSGADCNDANAAINPGATEIPYNGVDEDCDGVSDYDADRDGAVSDAYGGTDCDDSDASINPSATEIWYNGIDENCDGNDDDQDGDGFSSDTVTGGDDCDDGDTAISPAATEICEDNIDNDCDGLADGCGPYGRRAATDADAIIRGETAGDRLAQGDPGFDGLGDMNGDGIDDFIVGALRESSVANRAGAAYIFYGPVSGTQSAATADAKLTGEADSDFAGGRLAGVGDLNNDGFDDAVVGAIFDDTAASNAGAAYVTFGPITGTVSLAAADAKWLGEATNDYAAEAAWTGDVNNDGLPDFLIGAENGDSGGVDSGIAYLVFGPGTAGGSLADADVIISGEAAGDKASSSLWGAGDVNNDGINDILIGARGEDTGGISAINGEAAGAAYLVLGPVTSDLSLASADAKWIGEFAGANIGFGVSISTAGDTNNDGYDDIVIGARRESDNNTFAGGAYIILGPVSPGTNGTLALADAKITGIATADKTGDSVHGPGDVDNDGFDDVLLGSGYSSFGATDGGALYLVNGPISGTVDLNDADGIIGAEGASDRARVHGVGDIDNDGHADVMMGSMLNDGAGADAGAVYLFLGSGL